VKDGKKSTNNSSAIR